MCLTCPQIECSFNSSFPARHHIITASIDGFLHSARPDPSNRQANADSSLIGPFYRPFCTALRPGTKDHVSKHPSPRSLVCPGALKVVPSPLSTPTNLSSPQPQAEPLDILARPPSPTLACPGLTLGFAGPVSIVMRSPSAGLLWGVWACSTPPYPARQLDASLHSRWTVAT